MSDSPPKAVEVDPPPADKPKGGKGKKPQGRPLSLQRELEDLFTQMGAMAMLADQFDGMVIINQAPDNAEALAKLANKNARVKKALEALTQVSALAGAGTVVGATLIPILMHHGVVPVQMPLPEGWLKPPEQLEFIEEMKRAEAEAQAKGGASGGTQPQ